MSKEVRITTGYVAEHFFCKFVTAPTKYEVEEFFNSVGSLFTKDFMDEVYEKFEEKRKKWEEDQRNKN